MGKQVDYEKIEKSAKIRKNVTNTIIYVLLTIWALVVLFPFYWMLLTSVKSYSSYNSEYIPQLITLSPTLQN
ncbi:MAG: carbohydrate ABC transporter permease, partial [Roseburia sp.]|nr:carbohydrate ABC transporter permease [Roseburia sp.]